jgi:uncharacterized protein YegP (UPF0339 family)
MSKFKVAKAKSGQYYFSLFANNNEIIATGGETYSTKDACINGVKSVQKNAPIAAVEDQTVEGFQTESNPKFEIYKDKAGEFRFRLKARNGEPIAASEGYTAKASCKNGIASVVKNAPNAEIVDDEYLKTS